MNKPKLNSIYSGTMVIPMADVQHIEKLADDGVWIVTCHTKWNWDEDCWENPISLDEKEGERFIEAWYEYRRELEAGEGKTGKAPKDCHLPLE